MQFDTAISHLFLRCRIDNVNLPIKLASMFESARLSMSTHIRPLVSSAQHLIQKMAKKCIPANGFVVNFVGFFPHLDFCHQFMFVSIGCLLTVCDIMPGFPACIPQFGILMFLSFKFATPN